MTNFLDLPPEESGYKQATTIILQAPWERTTSYGKGAGEGPEAIIRASSQVEFYDIELNQESYKPAIHTLPAMNFGNDAAQAMKTIEMSVTKVLEDQKFPVLLGGEHSVSAGAVAATAKKHPNLSILQIDAHADLRDSYQGTPWSHASVMRRCLDSVKKIVGVGIRSVCVEEMALAKEDPRIDLFYDYDFRDNSNWIERVISCLTDTVYLTVDVDGFTPELISATGTPEPGGLSWMEGMALFRRLFQTKKVVACDVVELAPQPNHHVSDFVTAKLVYKLIGYKSAFQKR